MQRHLVWKLFIKIKIIFNDKKQIIFFADICFSTQENKQMS